MRYVLIVALLLSGCGHDTGNEGWIPGAPHGEPTPTPIERIVP